MFIQYKQKYDIYIMKNISISEIDKIFNKIEIELKKMIKTNVNIKNEREAFELYLKNPKNKNDIMILQQFSKQNNNIECVITNNISNEKKEMNTIYSSNNEQFINNYIDEYITDD